jgi:tight adherence protein B
MNILLLGVIIFTFSLLVLELTFHAFRTFMHPDRAEVRRRLRQSMAEKGTDNGEDIYKKNSLSEVPFMHQLLARLPGIDQLQLTINQANVKFTLGFFALLSIGLGFVGYLLGALLAKDTILALLIAVCSANLPMLYVRSQKKKRMAQFEKQLPEALGLIARALRAGHAFTSGMKLAADEFNDPLGPEFEEALDEINFGQSVTVALKNLVRRVDCPDLNFFVVSVILQRETGGNLAEIIEGLAHLIRERFKFRGKVRTLTAEGRLSAVVLYVLPVLLAAFLFLFHPDVVAPLYEDPVGRVMASFMIGLMILGFFMIRRIIKVEV